MKKIYLIILVLIISGCANNQKEKVYVRTFDSGTTFEKASTQCQYEVNIQSRADERTENKGGGILMSIIKGNATMESCMNRFGFSLTEKNSPQALAEVNKIQEAQANQVEKNRIRNEIYKDYSSKYNSVCIDVKNTAYFNKTTCSPIDLTIAQLADETKPNDEEKVQILKVREQVAIHQLDFVRKLRSNGLSQDKQLADALELFENELVQNSLNLYGGKITWGEFNQVKKNIYLKAIAEYRKLFPQSN